MSFVRWIDHSEIRLIAAIYRAHRAGLTYAEIDDLGDDALLMRFGVPGVDC